MHPIIKILREYRFFKSKNFGNIWNYIHGFSKETISNSKITRNNYKYFINDRDYINGHPYNGVYSSIIDNKLYLPYLFRDYLEYIPKYYFFKDKSGFLPLSDINGLDKTKRYDIHCFFDLLYDNKKLVLKHCYSSLGEGFMLIEKKNDSFFLNGSEITKESLSKQISILDNYIITEFVTQHKYSSEICSTSLNTLRLLCVWDEDKKTFFIARAFHRFGCNGNVVDNVGSGNGLLVYVNPLKGVFLSHGIMNSKSHGEFFVEHIKHPDNNIILEGVQIPNYKAITNKVIEICNSISFLRYMGIDLAVTSDGFKIIEINSLPSVEAVQQFEGFLIDSRIRNILKK